LKLTDHSDL